MTTLYLASDVNEIRTSVHQHKRKRTNPEGEPFAVDCADEQCIDDLKRYGAAENLRSVPKTFDEREAEREALRQQELVLPHLAREMVRAGRASVQG